VSTWGTRVPGLSAKNAKIDGYWREHHGFVRQAGSRIPPTINYETPDPDCDLNYGTEGMIERPVRLALSNSFGFGGHNVCLAIKRFDG